MMLGGHYTRLNKDDRFKRDMRIIELRKEGKTYSEICDIMGCFKSAVSNAIIKYGQEYGIPVTVKKPPKIKASSVSESVKKPDEIAVKTKKRNQDDFKKKGECMIEALVKEDFASLQSRGERARAYAPVYLRIVGYLPPIERDIADGNSWKSPAL